MGESHQSKSKKKKVGFAATSQGFGKGEGGDVIQMRTRPILSDEHEQT